MIDRAWGFQSVRLSWARAGCVSKPNARGSFDATGQALFKPSADPHSRIRQFRQHFCHVDVSSRHTSDQHTSSTMNEGKACVLPCTVAWKMYEVKCLSLQLAKLSCSSKQK
eukprot:3573024-Pleurochrysis_carterae.AAC.2